MTNILKEQQQANKELINKIETLKKQLSNKEQEITELKNPGEVSEEEEVEFKQEAMERIHQMLIDMRERFPHCSKNIEQDLRKLISKPLRNQFMTVCFQHSLMHDYKWEGKENLEKVVERIIIDYFEDTELATELKKDWELWNQRAHIFSQIEEGGEIFGRPAKDIILKDIIESKVERIKDLEAKQKELEEKVEELEERVDIEVEMNLKALDKAKEWRERQFGEKEAEYTAKEKALLKRIEILENNILWLKNKEQIIKKYKDKELPALPKQQKQNRLIKFKQLVSKVKETSKEKFQTFVIQKHK